MRRFSWMVACLALVALLVSPVFAANEPITVAKVSKVVVDGDLADWGGVPGLYLGSKMSADATGIDGDDDNSAFVMFAYDADNLYLGIRVIDDILNMPRKDKLWEQDGFDMWFGPVQYGFSMVDGKPVIHEFWGGKGTKGMAIELVPAAGGGIHPPVYNGEFPWH